MQLFPPNGGTLSPYLVGSFDLRNSQNTIVQLINPTAQHSSMHTCIGPS